MCSDSSPVVAAVDGSESSFRATVWAAAEAVLRRSPLHIISPCLFSGSQGDPSWAGAGPVLEAAARVARTVAAGHDLIVSTERAARPILPVLVAASRTARILVVGGSMEDVSCVAHGSVGTMVARYARCSVAVVPSESDRAPIDGPVLVWIDGTERSVPAIAAGFDAASRRGVELVALHAWCDDTGLALPGIWNPRYHREAAALGQSLAGWAERYPDVRVRRELLCDKPIRSLREQSELAQLVVIGHGGDPRALSGSTVAALLDSVRCPMLVARAR
ncbi:universal stress protein [Nocardia sp. NBC_01503]|uniref:universal stress protein n=1 Tax=Nocardia sp. NBC_01503 TaxID=2975997 RepID=UPI002E7BAFA1|nr:universal stress protein [Nocardia sp. NBC_01503]WTL30590.1 universal stress protein [Nocardia sp. NBC_01503]